jgi:UDP-glucose 4-epimerase
MSKKILVTGGAGFIGSHLCEKLAKDHGNEVYSLDNYLTGSSSNHVDGVTYIDGGTHNIEALVDFPVDIVFHLGEYSRVEQSFDDLDIVWASNKTGTFAVLQFCLKHNCRLIYAGSSTKFGDGGIGRNQSPYGWTKASNTELIRNFGEWFGIEYAIVYFYNVYGPREISSGKYATLIALFAEKMSKGELLGVVSPGDQQRNFTHVSDIISGLELVGEYGVGDDYGIGHPQAFTVMEIAKMFGGKIEMLAARPGNRMTAEVISDKTVALGWSPKIRVEDYIASLIDTSVI